MSNPTKRFLIATIARLRQMRDSSMSIAEWLAFDDRAQALERMLAAD